MCLDCSGIHRNLGSHISKVRSLTLDTDCWREEMIIYFESIGNATFNSVWESCLPSAALHPKDFRNLPALRESYIRRKYIDREFTSYFHSVIPHSEAEHALCGWVEKLGGKQPKLVWVLLLKSVCVCVFMRGYISCDVILIFSHVSFYLVITLAKKVLTNEPQLIDVLERWQRGHWASGNSQSSWCNHFYPWRWEYYKRSYWIF